MFALHLLLLCTILLVLLPTLILFIEVIVAVLGRHRTADLGGSRPRLAIIMPANNEELVIADALRALTPQLMRSDRLIVIADNCSDSTAHIAIAEGADVIVRTDAILRGKGYALDFGVRHLESDPPAIVIIVDADCIVATGAIDRLARTCSQFDRPIQALYLMRASQGSSPLMRIAEFASALKNRVRPLGLHGLGLPCQLMGTGMTFPWSTICAAHLATGHIVEDLKLGIDLTRSGAPPQFCPDALVTSAFPMSSEGIKSQRTRWEHGHLAVILSEGPRLLLESVLTLNVNMMALALDLMVPPVALLVLLVAGIWLIAGLWFALTAEKLPLELATTAVALLGLSILLSWARYGRQIVSFGGLVLAALYTIRKIPLYFRFLVARELKWIKSKRDSDES